MVPGSRFACSGDGVSEWDVSSINSNVVPSHSYRVICVIHVWNLWTEEWLRKMQVLNKAG